MEAKLAAFAHDHVTRLRQAAMKRKSESRRNMLKQGGGKDGLVERRTAPHVGCFGCFWKYLGVSCFQPRNNSKCHLNFTIRPTSAIMRWISCPFGDA